MTQPMEFEEPEEISGVRINPSDVLGHLLLVWAIEYKEHSPTRFSKPDKKSDVIVVDLVDLDLEGEDGGDGYLARRQWWRQGRLIQVLRPKVGRPNPMLAVMSKGVGAAGFQDPFVLVSASQDPQSVQRANQWFQKHPDFKPSVSDAQFQAGMNQATVSQPYTDPWAPDGGNHPEARPPLQRGQQSTSDLMSRLKAEAARKRAESLPPPPNQGPAPF